MKLLIIFVVLSVINVIFSTVRSIATISGSKLTASLLNGGYFAFYNIMLLYTVADFPMWQKCVITFLCNIVGVYIVKLIEEKMRKDKLWKIEFTAHFTKQDDIIYALDSNSISYNYLYAGEHIIFNCFCSTQEESLIVKQIIKEYNAKYFASETKLL